MNSTVAHNRGISEAWFFTSELEAERAGSFRQDRWCRVFLELGLPVRIFNVRGFLQLTSARFASVQEFEAFRVAVGHRSGPRASVREGLVARILRRVKHAFLIDLYYPNIFRLVYRALSELRGAPARVLVMGSSPPFSLAVAAAIVRVLRPGRVELAVDMRDAWAMHLSLGGSRGLKLAIEGLVLRRASGISAVSYGLAEEFEENHGVKVDVLYNVATHYFETPARKVIDWKTLCPEVDPSRLKLVYTGSTPEDFYDLPSLVAALKLFRAETPELADRIQLVFVGACDAMRRELHRQGAGEQDVVFAGHVPHALAKMIQQNADGLLYLTYRGRGAVSTKIFEYFALSKPIFPLFVPTASDVDHLLKNYGGVSMVLHQTGEIVAALRGVAGPGGLEALPCCKDPMVLRRLLDEYRDYSRRLSYIACSEA